MFRQIRPVMINIGAISTYSAGQGFSVRHLAALDSPANFSPSLSLFWIQSLVLALNLAANFWMSAPVGFIDGLNFLRAHFVSFAIKSLDALNAPCMPAAAIAWGFVVLLNRLSCAAFCTGLNFHHASNNNAPRTCPVKLPRPHETREGRSYQYSTRACGLGNFYYTRGGE